MGANSDGGEATSVTTSLHCGLIKGSVSETLAAERFSLKVISSAV